MARAGALWAKRRDLAPRPLESALDRRGYPALDGLRCYAAFLVLLVHLMGGLLTEYYRLPEAVLSVQSPVPGIATMMFLADGHHGVDVFFLISGFLMARITRPGMSWSRFVARRFLRIYPAFLASLLLCTAVYVNLYDWPFVWRDFALNLVFFNAVPGNGILAYNHVSWTLGYEFAFYLVVPLLAAAANSRLRSGIAAAAGIAAFVLLEGTPMRMAGLFGGFLLGSVPDSALRVVAARVPILIPLAAYCALVWAKALVPLQFTLFLRLLLPVASLLLVCIVFGSNPLNRFFASRPMRRLGQWSYSIYLLHPLVLALVLYEAVDLVGLRYHEVPAVAFICIATVTGTVALAAVWYALFEAPYFRSRRASGAPVGACGHGDGAAMMRDPTPTQGPPCPPSRAHPSQLPS